jgi:pimeloyl-ACP methyl ester carboxylesterase
MIQRIGQLSRDSCRDLRCRQIPGRDGYPLQVYECGPRSARPVVIVGPIGVPILVVSRLMRTIGAKYRVISWEQRGCDCEARLFLEQPHDFAAFESDLAQVVEATEAARCALIGVCSGASLALSAVAHGLVQAAPLVLVSPLIRFVDGYVPSLFDRAIVPYMQKISEGNQEVAKEMLEMDAVMRAGEANDGDEDERLMDAANRWNLRSLETLLVYARAVRAFSVGTMDAEIAIVRQKVLVCAAADDKTVSIRSVRKLAGHLPGAQLLEYRSGGHYIVFTLRELQVAIRKFIEDWLGCDQEVPRGRPAAAACESQGYK